MNFENQINSLVLDTTSKTAAFSERMHTIVGILNRVFLSLNLKPECPVKIDGFEYDFDDLLILTFELAQLIAIFNKSNGSEKELIDFLTCHCPRLVALCIDGRLNYIHDIIKFKKIVIG